MRIAIASDHAGYKYKEEVKKYLQSKKYEVVDFGTDSEESCDYPDFIFPAAGAIANGECDRGIVFGGSGNGEAMTANKIKGIRCAVCWNVESAKLASSHNNANMIAIGQRMMDLKTAFDIVDAWLTTPFEGGRHIQRIKKMEES